MNANLRAASDYNDSAGVPVAERDGEQVCYAYGLTDGGVAALRDGGLIFEYK
jgi:hypothetical protein